MSKHRNYCERVTVNLLPDQRTQLQALADAQGMTLGTYLRVIAVAHANREVSNG